MMGMLAVITWMVTTTPPTLECPQIEGPTGITLDGKLKEAAWTKTKALTEDRITIQGLVNVQRLILGVECREREWPQVPEKPQSNTMDDLTVKDRAHIEILFANAEATEYYRVWVSPEGAVYDLHQTKVGQRWIDDINWSGQSAVSTDPKMKTWSVETAFPWKEGAVQISRKGPGASSPNTRWIPLKLVVLQPEVTAAPNELSKLTDEELTTLAKIQAGDPTAVETFNKTLDLMEKNFAIMADETLTREQLKEKILDLQRLQNEVGWGKMGNLTKDHNLEETLDQIEQMRPMMKPAQEMMKPQLLIGRAIANARSLGEFINGLREQHGDQGLAKLPSPKMADMMSLSMGGGMMNLGKKQDPLPKTWAEMTEDQYQSMRSSRLQAFTPAGQELFARQVAKFMPKSKDPQKEGPP